MLKRLIPLVAVAFLLTNCTDYDIPDKELTNKEKMNQLTIDDPLVWNSLAEQAINLDSIFDGGMKAGYLKGMDKEKAYPNKGYYYTIFEDLYPSQGDYDFNDVMLETKLYMDGKKGEVWGKVSTTVYHIGGALNTKIGLMFYSVKGNKEYERISNDQILINGDRLSETNGEEPYTMNLPDVGTNFDVEYYVEDRTNNINQIWISWFIMVEQNGKWSKILTSGFPEPSMKYFQIPQTDFLTSRNLPWGLELEAEEFHIPVERAVFLEVFPEFQEWAETGGVKNKKWFEHPDFNYIQ